MISWILILLAGLCNGIMDSVLFNYYHKWIKDKQWWDSTESWRNKYTNRDPKQGRNNLPIFLTDAFHFFKSIMLWAIVFAIYLFDPIINWWVDILTLRFIFGIGFWLPYQATR